VIIPAHTSNNLNSRQKSKTKTRREEDPIYLYIYFSNSSSTFTQSPADLPQCKDPFHPPLVLPRFMYQQQENTKNISLLLRS